MTRDQLRRVATPTAVVLLCAALAGCASVVGVSDAPAGTVGGVLQPKRAEAIAAQVIEDATRSAASPGPEGDALREVSHTGDALTAARADARLAVTVSQEVRDARLLTSAPPVVLAVSRGLGYPRSMVVQTTIARSGLLVLYLLTTPDVRTPFKIAARAPMLASASVRAFDPLAQGSPGVGDGSGLAVEPDRLTSAYAASLGYPPSAATGAEPFARDSFAAGVRAVAQSQNEGLNGALTYTQAHSPKAVAGGLRVAGDRGALVFTVLERQDTFVNTSPTPFAPSAAFTALTGARTVPGAGPGAERGVRHLLHPGQLPAVAVGAEQHLYAASAA